MRTTHSSETGRLTAETFTDAWAQGSALGTDDDLGEWLLSVATKEAVSSLRFPKATTTGRQTPKNLRIVVDEASIDAVARELLDTDPGSLPNPPAAVWSRIERRVRPAELDGPTEAADDSPAERRDRGRSGVPRWALAGAVVAAIAAAAVATVLFTGGDGTTTLATATLEPVGDLDVGLASGTATLQQRDGRRELRIRMDTPPYLSTGSFYELALVDDHSQKVVLGRLRNPAARVDETFPLPHEVEKRTFRTVDLSLGSDDDAGADGATSVMRGRLQR
ncbi:MAG: anti-sigma factor [Microthrixaceae bacterium]|nr:anti-sigma factor [Microthrixaceae bacterium]